MLKPSALPGASWLVCEGYYLSFAYFHSINSLDFCIQLCFSFFYFITPLKSYVFLTHTHMIHCKITLNLVDNNYAIAKYDFDNPIFQAEDEGEEDCEVPGELVRLLQQEDRVIQPHKESIEVVNLGTDKDRKEIKIGAGLENSVKERLIQMLRDYIEVFAWSYEDMPGLDIDIVVHRLPSKVGFLPVKQKVRRMHPEMSEKIKAEVMKQFNAGFLAVTSYPQWVANVEM